jgi:hypothetical protein
MKISSHDGGRQTSRKLSLCMDEWKQYSSCMRQRVLKVSDSEIEQHTQKLRYDSEAEQLQERPNCKDGFHD